MVVMKDGVLPSGMSGCVARLISTGLMTRNDLFRQAHERLDGLAELPPGAIRTFVDIEVIEELLAECEKYLSWFKVDEVRQILKGRNQI